MTTKRPGLLAIRSVNQYRSREVMSYLGLRYYLKNVAARSDDWAQQVSTNLVLNRTVLPYFRAYHFKEKDAHGKIIHRPIFLPCPNEALAEATLLAECANHPEIFSSPSCVFSYRLSEKDETFGMYRRYFEGLKERQNVIASACQQRPDGIVLYTDIKRFYPSITTELAHKVWLEYAHRGLPSHIIDLGTKLIGDHGKVSRTHKEARENGSILTGPMFSHLIGNLVLREIDEEFSVNTSVRYFRYVDDITLVGEKDIVRNTLAELRTRLESMGFQLHSDDSYKTIWVTATEWLEGENDFQCGDLLNLKIKNFLFTQPQELSNLECAFLKYNFRIPLKDYSVAAVEASRVGWFHKLASFSWFKQKIIEELSIAVLLNEARLLRELYQEEFFQLAEQLPTVCGYKHKQVITKLRYIWSRLIYLASENKLEELIKLVTAVPELYLQVAVTSAVITGNIDNILIMGTNAAQITAQVMRASRKRASCNLYQFSEIESQALAVFLVNGVEIDWHNGICSAEPELVRFARSGGTPELMCSSDSFLRELSCLHGIEQQPRHAQMLETAFDQDEELTMDAIAILTASFPD